MKIEETLTLSPKMLAAVDELKSVVLNRYPDAQFRLSRGPDEPEAVHLKAIVDVDDLDEVVDLIIDRMMQFQIEDELPIWVVPIHPIERVAAMLAARANGSEPPPTALL
jgi:hypothetical protein